MYIKTAADAELIKIRQRFRKMKDNLDRQMHRELADVRQKLMKQCKHQTTITYGEVVNYHDWQEDKVTSCSDCGKELRRV